MQKKSIIVPLLGLIGVGLIFASSGVFPDTVPLPRFPTGPGTIGGVLTAFFNSDGTAKNTESLSGATASGYLQNQDCTDPLNPAWVGIDPTGKAICGNTGPLLAIGTFTELHGLVRVWHDGAPGYTVASVGESLYPGDLIESDATGTGTIAFSADNSLIRFSVDTDLELRYGDLDGLTVAEVILNDGRLWGRILSATGVNLGGGGLVTGVRGTSVDIIKSSTGYYTVTITDSVNTNSKISSLVSAIHMKDFYSMSTISNPPFGGGVQFGYPNGSIVVTKLTQDKNLFYADNWVKSNTLLDVDYMSTELEKTFLSFDAKTRLNNELNATVELNNIGTLSAFLKDAYPIPLELYNATNLLNAENQVDGFEDENTINKNKDNRLKCKLELKTFFPTYPSPTGCMESWDTLARTDFGTLTGQIYGSKHAMDFAVSGSFFDGGEIGKIISSGNYIEYTGNLINISGKTIILELSGSVDNSGKHYIFDGGTTQLKIFKNFGVYFCYWKNSPYKCDSNDLIETNGGKTIIVNLPTFTPVRFIIGNVYASGFGTFTIGTQIKSISIK